MGDSRIKDLKKITSTAMKEHVLPEMNARLDAIENYCKGTLTLMEKRSKDFKAFIIQEVKFDIQNQLFNMSCTLDAIVEVLAESGIQIENLNEKVDSKKLLIAAKRKQEASDKMQAEMEKRAAQDTKSETQSS